MLIAGSNVIAKLSNEKLQEHQRKLENELDTLEEEMQQIENVLDIIYSEQSFRSTKFN